MKIGFICPNLPGHINPMSAHKLADQAAETMLAHASLPPNIKTGLRQWRLLSLNGV
jgi:hypothetical protein